MQTVFMCMVSCGMVRWSIMLQAEIPSLHQRLQVIYKPKHPPCEQRKASFLYLNFLGLNGVFPGHRVQCVSRKYVRCSEARAA